MQSFTECSQQLDSILPVGQQNGHMISTGQLFKQSGPDGFSDIWLSPFLLFLYTCFKNIILYWLDLNKRQSREEKAFFFVVVPEPSYHCESSPQKCPFDVCFRDAFCLVALQACPAGSQATSRHPRQQHRVGLQEVLGTGGGSLLKCQCQAALVTQTCFLPNFPSPHERNSISEDL